tara:strand:- start:8718 stop:9098 length:381 start_codon:yes stop_codon:yes gene_type:complete
LFTLLLSEFLLLLLVVVVVEKTFSAFVAFAFAARDDDDDEKGAGKMLFMVSLCLRFRRNDALQFEGMQQPKQRFGSAFVVIIVLCVTRIIRGVFVLHFVPHFSTNEYLKSVEIYDLSLTLLLSLTL